MRRKTFVIVTFALCGLGNIWAGDSNPVLLGGSYQLKGGPQWETNGIPVCIEDQNQERPWIATDGSGGAISVWQDDSAGNWDIYAQRIDSTGANRWAIRGIPICTHPAEQKDPRLISDGEGGAIIAWMDHRNNTVTGYKRDIYAQRVDSNGVALWAPNGVAVCCCPGDQYRYDIVSDGAGGVFICWTSKDATGNYDVYAQHITADGTFIYPSTWGKLICDLMWNDPQWPEIVSDGYGGAIIIWGDDRNFPDPEDIYAQRVDWNLGLLWHPSGVPIYKDLPARPPAEQENYAAVSDCAGGAIITWQDLRDDVNKGYDIYAQRVDVNGNIQWGPTGILVCDLMIEPTNQISARLVSDGSGGAIIMWYDYRNDGISNCDIYAQWVNYNGTLKWTPGGKVVCDQAGNQYPFMIVTDGEGGAIIDWQDLRSDNGDIYAQRVDWSGNRQWDWPLGSGIFNGLPICEASEEQKWPAMISDNTGGAIISWQDNRNLNWDIYAQRVYSDGRVGPHHIADLDIEDDKGSLYMNTMLLHKYPRPTIAFGWFNVVNPDQIDNNVDLFDGPGNEDLVNIDWPSSIILYHPTGPPSIVPVFVVLPAELPSGDATQGFLGLLLFAANPPLAPNVTYTCYCIVDGEGKHSGNPVRDFFTLKVSTHTISGPRLANGFWAIQEEKAIVLNWSATDFVEVVGVNLYRNEPGAESFNQLNSSILTGNSYTDGDIVPGRAYDYKLGLVFGDRDEIRIGPLSVTASPASFALSQNYPNPCREFTIINYQLPRCIHTTLRIYDVTGRLVKTLVDEEKENGVYSVTWDGKDNTRRTVANGIYFYRLTAGDFTSAKKLFLMK